MRLRDRLLRFAEVETRVALGKTLIYELISKQLFPAGRRVGSTKAVRWLESEIDAWVAAYAAGIEWRPAA